MRWCILGTVQVLKCSALWLCLFVSGGSHRECLFTCTTVIQEFTGYH